MGPVELADTVGLDICLSVAENLSGHYGGTVPERLSKLVEAGHLGRKTGQGFYKYHKGKKVKHNGGGKQAPKDLTDRLILIMLNEAVACLREKVVEDMDLLDAGMIFGTGFAPFRGGPMQYAKHQGATSIQQTLTELAEQHGKRFTPDSGWTEF